MSPPFPIPTPARLLGEVIAWSCARAVSHSDLLDALRAAGLDEGVARELAPRHAFSRACKRLSDRRVIRPVAGDGSTVTFQFTAESRTDERFEYALETMLVLDKKTGLVSCDRPELAAAAQAELDRCIAVRTGSDVTRVVQRLFERRADLFAVRPQGGCYFVPRAHAPLVDKVQALLGRLNGRLLRFPVPAGTAEGDRSVREAVADGLAALVAEHREAVARLDADSRPDTLERAAEKIRTTRLKVEAYAEYLSAEKARLERELADARKELRARVEAIAGQRAAEAPLAAECPLAAV